MGLVRRIRDITMATLNERLEKTEDPVKLIDQFLWSTRDEIIQAEKLHHQYLNHSHQLKTQWLQAEQLIEKKEQQAMLALKAGEEALARMALSEKTMFVDKANSYRELYEQSNGSMVELEEQLQELRYEYQLVYDKREYYVARMESIRLQQRMNQRNGFSSPNKPGEVIRRMEGHITDLELEAKSLRDVRKSNVDTHSYETIQKKLDIDRELDQLKQKMSKEGWSL